MVSQYYKMTNGEDLNYRSRLNNINVRRSLSNLEFLSLIFGGILDEHCLCSCMPNCNKCLMFSISFTDCLAKISPLNK